MVGAERLTIGILALQGDFGAHRAALSDLAETRLVRQVGDLAGIRGLILPGGESTTQERLMKRTDLFDAVKRLGEAGMPMLGTCAGAILLSRRIKDGVEDQEGLALLDMTIERNAYGRQVDSFETEVPVVFGPPMKVVCIRAPRFLDLAPGIEVLLEAKDPLWIKSGSIQATTFHPELTDDRRVQESFLESARSATPESLASWGRLLDIIPPMSRQSTDRMAAH